MKLSFKIMFADHQMKAIHVLSSGSFDVAVSGENNLYQVSLVLLEKMLESEKFGFRPIKGFTQIVNDYFEVSKRFILDGDGMFRISISLQDEPDSLEYILKNYQVFSLR